MTAQTRFTHRRAWLAAVTAAAVLAVFSVSARQAPDPQAAVNAAFNKYKALKEGKNADYIPALAKVNPDLFGIALYTADGKVYTAGDVATEVSIQSISKVFTMAQVINEQGPDSVEKRIGVDATGMRFNSIVAVEFAEKALGGPELNPLVNPGAITTTSMVTGTTADAVWNKIIGMHNDFAGRQLKVLQDVYKSESDSNQRNQAIGMLMYAYELHQVQPGAGDRPLHTAVLDRRQREGPGDDGRHAGVRRQESDDRQAGHRGQERPVRPGGDGHRRVV